MIDVKVRRPPDGAVNRPRRDGKARDRGVSEVVAFILTFSIITTMVGVLYTAGFASLDQLQTGNQMTNAEGVFLAMSDSFGELQEGQAPKRAGALDLDVGASLTIRNDSVVDVGVNGPSLSWERELVLRSLDYELDGRAVTYETGAVFRTDQGESAMIGDPPEIFCSPDQRVAVVSIVSLRAPGSGSVASGTTTVTGVQQSSTLLYPDDRTPADIDNVTIDVTSPNERAWNRHLEQSSGWSDPDGDGTFECDAVDQVFVRHTVVNVRLGS